MLSFFFLFSLSILPTSLFEGSDRRKSRKRCDGDERKGDGETLWLSPFYIFFSSRMNKTEREWERERDKKEEGSFFVCIHKRRDSLSRHLSLSSISQIKTVCLCPQTCMYTYTIRKKRETQCPRYRAVCVCLCCVYIVVDGGSWNLALGVHWNYLK